MIYLEGVQWNGVRSTVLQLHKTMCIQKYSGSRLVSKSKNVDILAWFHFHLSRHKNTRTNQRPENGRNTTQREQRYGRNRL